MHGDRSFRHMTITANRTPPTRLGVTVASGQHAVTEVLRNEGDNGPDRVGNELARYTLFSNHGHVHKVDVTRKLELPVRPAAEQRVIEGSRLRRRGRALRQTWRTGLLMSICAERRDWLHGLCGEGVVDVFCDLLGGRHAKARQGDL